MTLAPVVIAVKFLFVTINAFSVIEALKDVITQHEFR